ncbi:MAG: hypothetical protein HDQ96_00660 [Lachnospiraceae bacterium]|nr:hypothetical protein [Lachnospiraceae bacterium]
MKRITFWKATKSSIILIPVVMALIFVFLYKVTGIYYGINDDTSMMGIASGKYTGIPDGHTVFIRYALGVAISALYRIDSTIDWYGLSLLFCMYFSLCLLIIVLFEATRKANNRLYIRIGGICVVLLLSLKYLIFFQFTTVAGITCATALFLIAVNKNQDNKLYIFIEVILFILTDMIRRKVFLMGVPFALLLIMANIFEPNEADENSLFDIKYIIKSRLKKIIQYGIIIGGILSCIILVEFVENIAYSSEEWSNYRQYKSYRAQIVDYNGFPVYEGNEAFWDSLDISAEEQAILPSSFGILPDIDYKDLQSIALYSKETKQTTFTNVLSFLYQSIIAGNIMLKVILFFVLFVVAYLCLNKKVSLYLKFKLIALIALALAEMLYIAWNGRLPARVFYVWLILIASCVFGTVIDRAAEEANYAKLMHEKVILFCSFLVIVAVNIYSAFNIYMDVQKYNTDIEIYQSYTTYLQNYEDIIFVVDTGIVNSRKRYFIHNEDIKLNTIGSRGWSSTLPLLVEYEKSKGLDPEEIFLVQENVRYLTVNMDRILQMDNYLKSIGYAVNYEIVDDFSLSNGGIIYVVEWK